ncbi:polysaccharide biosynthesis C-terminal domain-containing protein [Rhodohalobacter sp. 8-1]|uniref:polysaccharide biosynthesis C-terminal domain-containing protein n=1 Tax=Rhodohalobacter sp. 8-1 TaxID=3131972 RepID=UPI0030EF5725
MKKVGITGQSGFIGTHLANTIRLLPDEFKLIPFEKEWFKNEKALASFVAECDCIVHLAAVNRHGDPQVIYDTNVELVESLIDALETSGTAPQIIFSSSSQEEKDNLYGKSKRDGRRKLAAWAEKHSAIFNGLIIPNVFGPFGDPYYNSVVATFSHQLTHGKTPQIHQDSMMNLIYVGELVEEMLDRIRSPERSEAEYSQVNHTSECKVSELLAHLRRFKANYAEKGVIPELKDTFELNLFNTFRSYLDHKEHFPVKYTLHSDSRGSFVETIRLNSGGQVSFSTTVPGITRGNHFHTRKIERFAVIKGEARIDMRRIGTNEVLSFRVSGEKPGYVDMPIWYTHNITNTGENELYTIFWINEFYDPEDSDTYPIEV